MKRIHIYIISAIATALASCSPKVPTDAAQADALPSIYPDYADVTVPCNIAPMNFMIEEEGSSYITCLKAPGAADVVVKGKKIDIEADDWRKLTAAAKGDTITADVYVKRDGKWSQYKPVKIAVAEEIDPYISYRLIEPSYTSFEEMRICQRDLTNFDESTIYNNTNLSEEDNGQCINCHAYQDYNRGGNMQLHVRVNHGGTVIVKNGTPEKVQLKSQETGMGCAYPAWHPTLPLIAYSNNSTTQIFHSRDNNKIEVQDATSALSLYDIETKELKLIVDEPGQLETFPAWSPDGKWLYYASAAIPEMSENERMRYMNLNYKDFKYDLYRLPFDAATRTFGEKDTVFMASAIGKSATLPRISPDGSTLLFTMGEFGTFHIWHKDADLYTLDLRTNQMRPLDEVNSDDVESYHSWASNGKWIVFSSRRDDGNYTRLYIAHVADDGTCSKPFLLPQRDPEQNIDLYKSYNIPEFMAAKVTVPKRALLDAIAKD